MSPNFFLVRKPSKSFLSGAWRIYQTLLQNNGVKINADHKKVYPESVIFFIGQILSQDRKNSSPKALNFQQWQQFQPQEVLRVETVLFAEQCVIPCLGCWAYSPYVILKWCRILFLLNIKAMKDAINIIDSLTSLSLNDQKIHSPVGIFKL